ncbi:MAG TPA: hypothetical protein VF042_01205 [Gemmatimonadaceae bacterium]
MRKRIALALVLAACSSGESKKVADSTSADTSIPAPPQAVSLTAADLDGFEKGIAREIYLVKEGQERARRAQTPVERGNAIQSTFEENTISGAVEASGLTVDRYRLVRQTLSRLLTTLDFQGRIDGPQSVDTSLAGPEMRARLASDPYEALDPASAQLVRDRLGKIVPLWVEYINLTVVGG